MVVIAALIARSTASRSVIGRERAACRRAQAAWLHQEGRLDREPLAEPHKVVAVIVGAGMAGVTTAWALRQAGIRSIVLEAQDCIGGRIHTSRKWKNLPCDMGAEWVSHPTINPLIKIARKKKIELTPSDPSNIAIHGYSKDEVEVLFGIYGAAYAEVKLEADCRRNEGRRDVGLSKVLPGVLDKMCLDPRTRRGVEFLVDTSITQAYAAEQKELSLYNWDDNYTELFLGLWIVPDGYIRFVEMLKKGLDIRTKHVVCEIDRDEQGVSVKTRDHGEFRAPYAVVTVPHGVLAKGHIKFTPPLPPWKQEAIDRVRTGLSDKFWFHFPRKFWKSNRDVVGRTDPQGKWSLWLNFQKYQNEPLMLAFNRGKHAAKLEKCRTTRWWRRRWKCCARSTAGAHPIRSPCSGRRGGPMNSRRGRLHTFPPAPAPRTTGPWEGPSAVFVSPETRHAPSSISRSSARSGQECGRRRG
jgi:hypothetical protein